MSHLSKYDVNTSNGVFTGEKVSDLALLVFERFGSDVDLAYIAWCKMFEDPLTKFKDLIYWGRIRKYGSDQSRYTINQGI